MRKNVSELGSMMIEALAMLALIALVTPMLYKKSAERTMELQDINAASELRAIIKAVDDYVSSNYDAITNGETVTNTCGSQNYSSFSGATDAHLEVPIGHFCEFLPYGILDADGNAKPSRLFSADYKIILKLKGSAEADGDKVVTAFVVTDPQGSELQTVRASSIASMIGGNGGYVSETNGAGEESSGTVSGNLGIWGIENTRSELGVSVKKGAVVAASIQGVSSQNAKLDLSGVLYREEKSDVDLNTMSTTLYMGAKDAVYDGNNIVNIGKLIVGAQETAQNDDRLYINSGDVRIGTEGQSGNLYLDGTGNITVADGGLEVTGGDIYAHGKAGETPAGGGDAPLEGGNLYVDGAISAAAGAFTVATDGAVNALSYIAGGDDAPDAVKIHIASGVDGAYKTTINEPLEVVATGDCSYSGDTGNAVLTSDCALYVKGNALIDGDLTVTDTFSAKNLHAQEKLTVGGDNPDDSKALSVVYNKGAEGAEGTSTLNFGSGLLRVNQTGDNKGEFDFANNFVNINAPNTEDGSRTFNVNAANTISMETRNDTVSGAIHMNEASIDIGSLAGASSYALMSLQGADSSTESGVAGTIRMEVSNYLSMNDEAFLLTHTAGGSGVASSNEISSQVKSFKITPSDISGNDKYFQVGENSEGADAGDRGQVLMKGIKTYMLDTAQYLRNSSFHVQSTTAAESGATYNDVVRIAEDSSTDSQIDISGEKIVAHEKGSRGNSNKVIKIDLSAGVTGEKETTYSYDNENYPIYIRRGAIEMREVESGSLGTNTYKNYVQSDRFVANHDLESGALIDHSGTALTNMKYEVNPAYTSVMHDIKLTTRGGARLSDILPDFINKGIYVVDNTYPANNTTCNGQSGSSIDVYKGKSRADKQNLKACTNISQEVSPWAGFVPSPTCPPGYSKVITLTPASFAMAQAGIPFAASDRGVHVDLSVPLVVKSPFDYQDESSASDAAPVPLYYQKNTWLKSFVDVYPNADNFEGWDVGMGFIYPYNLYKEYITSVGGQSAFDNAGCTGSDDNCVIWNMFPVYAGTLEGYATVYCYFNRGGGKFNDSMVDTEYDQLNNYRAPNSKGTVNEYQRRLNDNNPDRTWSVW